MIPESINLCSRLNSIHLKKEYKKARKKSSFIETPSLGFCPKGVMAAD
jgi:hypothetical protein